MIRESDAQRLFELIAAELRCKSPMTEQRIARAIYRRTRVRIDARTVRLVMRENPHRFIQVRDRFGFLRRAPRWQLAKAGPAEDRGTSGAPVPAKPLSPLLSGAAAAQLMFREDKPPPQAIGRVI